MRRMLVLSLLVLATAAALALGSYSALAGSGPVAGVAGAVFGDDDGGGGEVVAQEVEDGDVEGTQKIAEAIAGVEAFETTPEDVLALHDQGIGFGAIFKLHALASAMGMSVEDLLATIDKNEDGEYEFAFGKLWQSLDQTQAASLSDMPKNLGQLVSGANGNGGDEDGVSGASSGLENAREKFAAKASRGHGPPEGVPAHGRR